MKNVLIIALNSSVNQYRQYYPQHSLNGLSNNMSSNINNLLKGSDLAQINDNFNLVNNNFQKLNEDLQVLMQSLEENRKQAEDLVQKKQKAHEENEVLINTLLTSVLDPSENPMSEENLEKAIKEFNETKPAVIDLKKIPDIAEEDLPYQFESPSGEFRI